MEAASICGTDLHLFNWDDWAAENLEPPRVLGHELAGTVIATGAGVTRVREGDLVGVESHLFDWTCAQCRRGDMHLCRNLRVIGVHIDGGFAEQVVIPEANAIESNGLDPAVVALQEPMGNAVHAAFVEPIEGRSGARHRLRADRPVRGRHREGGRRVAGDRHRHRAVPAGAGAHDGRGPRARRRRPGDRGADREATGGDGVDVVLEMSGARSGARPGAAARHARRAAISLLGIFGEPPTVDLSELVIMKGLRVHGIYGRRIYDTWERTQSLLRRGPSTSRRSSPTGSSSSEWQQAFDLIASRHAGKVVLVP